MPGLMVCPNGHRMWVDDDAGAQVLCSVCGAEVQESVSSSQSSTASPTSAVRVADPHVLTCPQGHRMWLDEDRKEQLVCSVCGAVVREKVGGSPPISTPPAGNWSSGPPAPLSPHPPTPVPPPLQPGIPPAAEERAGERGFALVSHGLGLHYLRLILFLVVILAAIAGVILGLISGAEQASGAESRTATRLVSYLTVALPYAAWVISPLGWIGSALCVGVPRSVRGRGLIAASLLLDLLAIPASVAILMLGGGVDVPFQVPADPVMPFEPAARSAHLAGSLATLASLVLGLLSWVYFIFFLRRLAEFLKESSSADEARQILARGLRLVVYAALALVAMVIVFFLVDVRDLGAMLFLVCGLYVVLIVLLLAFLVGLARLVVRQMNLVVTLRHVLRTNWT